MRKGWSGLRGKVKPLHGDGALFHHPERNLSLYSLRKPQFLLLHLFRWVISILMENQLRNLARFISDKGDFCFEIYSKEFVCRFRQQFKLWVARSLRHEPIAFLRYGQSEILI